MVFTSTYDDEDDVGMVAAVDGANGEKKIRVVQARLMLRGVQGTAASVCRVDGRTDAGMGAGDD